MGRLVVEAASKGAELVICPELALTGYSLMSRAEAEPFAENPGNPEPGSSVSVLKKLASKLGCAIAWGLIEKDLATSNLYNTQVLVLPDQTFVKYAKLNRWANDFLWATEGTESPSIVTFKGKRVGLLICRDVRDKSDELDDLYEKGDADLVVLSSNWGSGGFPSVAWHRFATNNHVWLAVSNRYGKEQNLDFGEGGVCIISPEGEVHCEGLVWNQDCIVYADIP